METYLLLVDEDEPAAAELSARLRDAGFVVDVETDGATALSRLALTPYACVLTELDLRPVSGLDVCRAIRADPRTAELPIIVLSTRAEEIDRVVAFEVGADDYVTKPCSTRELALRIRARLRLVRDPAPVARAPLHVGGLEIDPSRRRAALAGRSLPLTTTEFDLLTALARRRGAIVTRESLLREVWSLPTGRDSRTLDTHLRRLREKLGTASGRVQTIRGVGYRLVVSLDANDRHA